MGTDVQPLLKDYFQQPELINTIKSETVSITYINAAVEQKLKTFITIHPSSEWCVVGAVEQDNWKNVQIYKHSGDMGKTISFGYQISLTPFLSQLKINSGSLAQFLKNVWAQRTIQSHTSERGLPNDVAYKIIEEHRFGTATTSLFISVSDPTLIRLKTQKWSSRQRTSEWSKI